MSSGQLELFPKWLEYGYDSEESFIAFIKFYRFLCSNDFSVFDRIKECDTNRHTCFVSCWYKISQIK